MSGWGGATNNTSPFIFTSGTSGMPVTEEGYQLGTDNSDFWLGVMDPGGVDLNYATYFGGDESNEHVSRSLALARGWKAGVQYGYAFFGPPRVPA